MRKRTSILLAVLIIMCFAACGMQPHVHEFGEWEIVKEANCGEAGVKERACSCGEKETETIPASGKHQYTSEITKEASASEEGIKTYTCSVCGDSYTEPIGIIQTNWEVDYYVDEFGDKTNDAYVRGTFHGTFSNSATNGSSLTVLIYMDRDAPTTVQFRLLEYDSHKATAISSDKITLKIKNDNGSTSTFSLTYYQGDYYCTDQKLSSAIFTNEQISCVITISGNYTSITDTYKFKIDNEGLQELWNET